MKKIEIYTEFITLDSFLKFCGFVPSGGFAKKFILEGFVHVNGEVCKKRKKKIYSGDVIKIQDQVYEVTRVVCEENRV